MTPSGLIFKDGGTEASVRELILPLSEMGEEVGSLFIPPNLSDKPNTTLFIGNAGTQLGNQELLVSSVVNITLVSNEGLPITKLDSPLTICLQRSNSSKEKVCLGYYDESKAKWRCEDLCLTRSNGTDKNSFCGRTSHLTNFALLLKGNDEKDPCQEGDQGNMLSFVSLGFVAGAIVVVAIAVVILEIRIRWKKIQLEAELARTLEKAF